jgi:hypothetical protein
MSERLKGMVEAIRSQAKVGKAALIITTLGVIIALGLFVLREIIQGL